MERDFGALPLSYKGIEPLIGFEPITTRLEGDCMLYQLGHRHTFNIAPATLGVNS